MKKFQGDPSNYSMVRGNLRLKKKLRTCVVIICLISLIGAIFHEPVLLSYERWLSSTDNEFSGKADVLFFMDVNCSQVEDAARKVAYNEAEVLYAFVYDDVDRNFCQKAYDSAITKYNIRDRAYWGNTSYTTMGATQKFVSTMHDHNVKMDKILFTTVNFAIRRSYWSLKHIVGNGVKLNAYNSQNYTPLNGAKWWESYQSKVWIFAETQKMIGYWLYYGLLGKQEEYNLKEKDLPIKP